MHDDSDPLWPVDLDGVRLWPMESDDGPRLQQLFDELSDFESVLGERGDADAVSTFIALPEGVGPDAKLLLGVWQQEALIGAVDCIQGYPSPQDWTVGLLLVHQEHRGRGAGGSVLTWLTATAGARGATRIRFGLRRGNTAGRDFLCRRGYRPDPRRGDPPGVVVLSCELRP